MVKDVLRFHAIFEFGGGGGGGAGGGANKMGGLIETLAEPLVVPFTDGVTKKYEACSIGLQVILYVDLQLIATVKSLHQSFSFNLQITG